MCSCICVLALYYLWHSRSQLTNTMFNPNPIPVSDHNSNPTSNTNPNSTSHATSTPSTTLKLLHQNPSFQPFSGEGKTYSALTFLEACENSMKNSHITSGTDKTSFIRSSLKSKFVPSTMMQSSAFVSKLLHYSYSTSRASFLTAFGLTQHHDSLRWAFHHADSLTTQLSNSVL